MTDSVNLVQGAVAAVHSQQVVVAAEFDIRVGSDRVWAGVRFALVVKGQREFGCSGIRQVVRDADRAALPGAGTKVRVEAPGLADTAQPLIGERVDRQAVDARVPDVIGRE